MCFLSVCSIVSRFSTIAFAAFVFCASADAQTAPLTKEQIEAFTKSLEAASAKPLDDAIHTAILRLLIAIGKTDCSVEGTEKTDCKLAQIDAFIGSVATWPEPTAKQQAQLWKRMNPLLSNQAANSDTVVEEAVALAIKASRAEQAAENPDTAMSQLKELSSRTVASVKLAKPSDSLSKSKIEQMAADISETEQKLDTLLADLPQKPRINIVGAWYGDINAIRRAAPGNPQAKGKRFCSVSRFAVNKCQAQPECMIGVAGTPATEIIGPKLCGDHDPTPYARPEDTGLVVVYECLSVDAETWRTLGTDKPLPDDHRYRPRYARLLKGTVGAIRCQGKLP